MHARAAPEPSEPLFSPTGQLTQTVTVFIGNGDQVTVISEADGFSATGSFDAYTNPARVTVGLLPNQLNHLEVQAHVRRIGGGAAACRATTRSPPSWTSAASRWRCCSAQA